MKFTLVILMSLFAVSAFANVKQTIAQIEAERNVKCDQKEIGFQYCYGTHTEIANCRHTETFLCTGEENFGVKLTVKDFYNRRLGKRQILVSDIQFF